MSELLNIKQLPLVTEFLDTLISKHTKRGYKQDLGNFQMYLNNTPAAGWNSVLRQYKVHLATKYAPLSCNRMLASLKSYFQFLYLNQAIQVDASKHIELFKTPDYSATAGISDEETTRLLSTTSNIRDKLVLELLFYLGLRRNEIVTLKVTSVDLKHNPPCIVVVGKGNTKRILPLSERLTFTMHEYLNSLAPKYTGECLFPGPSGDGLHPNSITKLVKKYASQVGLDISPHVARATCVSNALEQGASIVQVQQLGGWASMDMVLRYDKRRQALHNSAAFKVNYAPKYTGVK